MIDIRLDEIDRRIMELLQKDPFLSQNEIAKRVELSQPSVSARIKRLKEKGFLAFTVGVNIKKTGLHVAKVEFNKEKHIEECSYCPYILGVVETEDIKTIYVVGEDFSSMESMVKKRFSRKDLKAVVGAYPDFVMPLKMEDNGGCEGCDCGECEYYATGKCLGCPFSEYYKGKLW